MRCWSTTGWGAKRARPRRPVIPLGILLTHLLVSPAPWLFIPFSLASNTVATLLAVLWVRRIAGDSLTTLRVGNGFVLLVGGVLSSTVSALIGVSGMVVSEMVPSAHFAEAIAKWMAGDIFGIVAVTPFALMILRVLERGRWTDKTLEYASRGEMIAWVIANVLGVILVVEASTASPAFALGLSFLPLAFLLFAVEFVFRMHRLSRAEQGPRTDAVSAS